MNKEQMVSKKGLGVYTYIRVPKNKYEKSLGLEEYRGFLQEYLNENEMILKGEYVDRGVSGYTIEGRQAFRQMLEDIANKKDEVSFILVYKLSHFSRNLNDIYSVTKLMKKNNVFVLIAKENLDTSLYEGRPMMAVLEAVTGKV